MFIANAYDQPWVLSNRTYEIWIEKYSRHPLLGEIVYNDAMLEAWQRHYDDDRADVDFVPSFGVEEDQEEEGQHLGTRDAIFHLGHQDGEEDDQLPLHTNSIVNDVEVINDMNESLDSVDDADALTNSILGEVEDMEQAREVVEMDVHDIILM